MRTFEEIWLDLENLKGKSICTLVNHVRSDILDVNSTGMTRRSEKWNQIKHVERNAFERAWTKLTTNGYCSLSDTWKFIGACLAHLPEVEYSLKPGTIWLTKKQHKFGELVEKK